MYLSLNPYLDIEAATAVGSVCPQFNNLPLTGKLRKLRKLLKKHDGVIFYRDYRFAMLFLLLFPFYKGKKIFHEFYLPAIRTGSIVRGVRY